MKNYISTYYSQVYSSSVDNQWFKILLVVAKEGNSPIEVLFWIILSSFHSVHCRIVNFQCIFRSEVLGASGTLVAEAVREVYGLDVVAHLRPLGPAL